VSLVLLRCAFSIVLFFFFQAEDGIRDATVTGVQTCALPISGIGIASEDQEAIFEEFRQAGGDYTRKREGTGLGLAIARKFVELRSEERRVGKECRSRWWACR